MTPKRILVTSALPYANGPLHLGHIAGAYLPADIYVRYQRLKGMDILFICGSDEHGVPITVTADQEGISPQDVVDRYHAMNKADFKRLGMSFDNYSRTSLPIHHETASDFFLKLHEKGDLVVKSEKQFYSEKSNQFLPDRYVEGDCPHCGYDRARGDQCDKCGKWLEPVELKNPRSKIDGTRPVLKDTSHWYMPMGRFADAWKAWFDGKTWKENVKNYCMGWFKEGLGDRPITRDLSWGVAVPLPEAKGKVLYVWFDAPIGYISSTKEWAVRMGDPDRWKEYWLDPETKLVHFIGKDNIVFHGILFPMMLAEYGGYVLPDSIPANEYLTIEGRKISTSQNYAVWVKDYLADFESDSLRYTLAANAPETKDTDFSWKQFQSRHNDELADILGNFVNRTTTFCHRVFGGKVPVCGKLEPMDEEMLRLAKQAPEGIGALLENFEVRAASKAFMDLARAANKYFNDKAPWDKTKSESAPTTIHVALQVAKTLAVVMEPFLPFASARLKAQLGIPENTRWDEAGTPDLAAGSPIGKPEILFKKIEDDIIAVQIDKLNKLAQPKTKAPAETVELVDIDSFKKTDLRTAVVKAAERVKGADKLLKLQIDLGTETKQIIAGIGQSYEPESLVGKTIIVVANLKPAVIRGVESKGMLLAVKTESGHKLLTVEGGAPGGLAVG